MESVEPKICYRTKTTVILHCISTKILLNRKQTLTLEFHWDVATLAFLDSSVTCNAEHSPCMCSVRNGRVSAGDRWSVNSLCKDPWWERLGRLTPGKNVSSPSFGREQKSLVVGTTTSGNGAVYGRCRRVTYIGATYPAFLRVEFTDPLPGFHMCWTQKVSAMLYEHWKASKKYPGKTNVIFVSLNFSFIFLYGYGHTKPVTFL